MKGREEWAKEREGEEVRGGNEGREAEGSHAAGAVPCRALRLLLGLARG